MKTGFLMAVFFTGALHATIEISAQQAEALFLAIENNSFIHVRQFFQQLYARDGEEAVVAYANIRDPENRTPLHRVQGPEMFEILFQYGANLNAENHEGQLPLVEICKKNDAPITESILNFILQISSGLTNKAAIIGFINNLEAVFESDCLVEVRIMAFELTTPLRRRLAILDQHNDGIRAWIDAVQRTHQAQNQTLPDPNTHVPYSRSSSSMSVASSL